jgi:hypothetical protein
LDRRRHWRVCAHWGAFSNAGFQGGSDYQGAPFLCVERVEKQNFFVPAADIWTSLTRAADRLELSVFHVYKQNIDLPGLDLAEFFYSLDAYQTIKLR